jgi:hypothetical protein
MYRHMRDLGGPVNLLASLTAWLNHSHYSGGCCRENEVAQDDINAERTLWIQDFIPSVDE